MSVSLYDISIPTYRRGLQNLASFLDKAEAHAQAQGADLKAYTDARLIDDMYPFSRQVQHRLEVVRRHGLVNDVLGDVLVGHRPGSPTVSGTGGRARVDPSFGHGRGPRQEK